MKNLSDEKLVEIAKANNADAMEILMQRYGDTMRVYAHKYYLAGSDREDVLQEARIGFCKAVRNYREGRDSKFKSFVNLCIDRHISTAVRATKRYKHILLNQYVPLDKCVGESDTLLIDSIADDRATNPEDIVIHKEHIYEVRTHTRDILSNIEYNSLWLFLNGTTYKDIAKKLHCGTKTVDNAIQRAKIKLNPYKNRN